jgi:hypothetical protein
VPQQQVACGGADGLVHLLETDQIDTQQSAGPVFPSGSLEHPAQPPHERGAAYEAGQGIAPDALDAGRGLGHAHRRGPATTRPARIDAGGKDHQSKDEGADQKPRGRAVAEPFMNIDPAPHQERQRSDQTVQGKWRPEPRFAHARPLSMVRSRSLPRKG